MQRVTTGDLASRQAVTRSERRAGLETDNAGADPFAITGKAAIDAGPSRNAKPVERHDSGGPAGVMARACLQAEDLSSAKNNERNTGSPAGEGV